MVVKVHEFMKGMVDKNSGSQQFFIKCLKMMPSSDSRLEIDKNCKCLEIDF